jgi:ABC-type glycerol-3-phosphate transport system permease component
VSRRLTWRSGPSGLATWDSSVSTASCPDSRTRRWSTGAGYLTINVSGTLAGATLIMLVPIAAFLVLQRQVIAGLTAGAGR